MYTAANTVFTTLCCMHNYKTGLMAVTAVHGHAAARQTTVATLATSARTLPMLLAHSLMLRHRATLLGSVMASVTAI
jgi:hypothetical protein